MTIEFFKISKKNPLAYSHKGWGVDIRHIMILYNLLLLGKFQNVLEVGVHMGASASAFVEAQRRCGYDLHLCDIKIEPHIRKLYGNNCFIHECKSTKCLQSIHDCDFVFLDGSHIAEDVMDEFELLSIKGVRNILLHDHKTQLLPAYKNQPWFDGPLLLSERLRNSPSWHCVEDICFRYGEETERGLFFSTKDDDIYKMACQVFNSISKYSTAEILKWQ